MGDMGKGMSTAVEATGQRSGTERMDPGFERGEAPSGGVGRRHVSAVPGMTGTEKAPTGRRARR